MVWLRLPWARALVSCAFERSGKHCGLLSHHTVIRHFRGRRREEPHETCDLPLCSRNEPTVSFPPPICALHVLSPTYNTLGKRGSLQRGETQVTNLDRASRTSDKDVVTLEVTVDYRGRPRVEEVEALQDLPAPAAQDFDLHLLEPFQVSGKYLPLLSIYRPPKWTITINKGLEICFFFFFKATMLRYLNTSLKDCLYGPFYQTKRQLWLMQTFLFREGKGFTHVFRVPEVISSVTRTMHFLPLAGDSQKS